ncbi:LysM domain-containing protein [Microbacterium sp. NPDC056044]|uniref:LysM peptidoglycan-binding domain-containing protein n=1 Tax=Microbacterium sp. NPDC056044 TaxID=3345690 RepID=UPI0035DB2E54
MDRDAKIAAGISVLVVAGLVAVATPAVATATSALSEWTLFSPSENTQPAPAAQAEDVVAPKGEALISAGNGTWFSAEGPGDCATNAAIHPYGAHDPSARLAGELTDMGVTEYASGEVGYTADGLIETYTVASGDSLIAIGERFCVDYVTVGAYNDRSGSKVIQPGDVLVLRP